MSDSINFSITAQDKFSETYEKLSTKSATLSQELREEQSQWNKLAKEQQTIGRYKKLEKTIGALGSQLDIERKQLSKLSREYKLTESPTKQLTNTFERQKQKVQKLSRQHKLAIKNLQPLSHNLKRVGIDTRKLADANDRLSQSMANVNKRMALQKQISVQKDKLKGQLMTGGAGLAAGAYGSVRTTGVMLSGMREIERAKGKLQSLMMDDTQSTIDAAFQFRKEYAGIRADEFIGAAYTIKSGIETLSDQGVAAMTSSAAITSRATESSIDEMTGMFVTGYSMFKDSSEKMKALSDADFADNFASAVAISVSKFRTTGTEMEQALKNTKKGLSQQGVGYSQQLAILGMLQASGLSGGESGTALESFGSNLVRVQEFFQNEGIDIQTVKDDGTFRDFANIVDDILKATDYMGVAVQKEFIKKAFGTKEAVTVFNELIGKTDDLRRHILEIDDVSQQGITTAEQMAKMRDDNWDARLEVLSNRWSDFTAKLGIALIPILETITPYLEKFLSYLEKLISGDGIKSSVIALGIALSPALIGLAALTKSISTLGRIAKLNSASITSRGIGGGLGKMGKTGGKEGRLSRIGRGLGKMGKTGGIAGLVSLTAGAAGSYGIDKLAESGNIEGSTAEKLGNIGESMLMGASYGAMIGSVIPGVGTAIGAGIGSILGGGYSAYQEYFSDESPGESMAKAETINQNDNRTNNNQYYLTIHAKDSDSFIQNLDEVMNKLTDTPASL